MIDGATSENGVVMTLETGLVVAGYLTMLGVLIVATVVSAKRRKQRGTSIWDSPAKQPGVSANWKWLAIALAAWALFSGGRFYTFTDEIRFTTVNSEGDEVAHVVELPSNGAMVKARFVLPDGSPAAGGLAHVHYQTPTHGVNLYQQLAASDDNGNLITTHFEEWHSSSRVLGETAYELEFIYKDADSNALYVHKQRFEPEGQRLFDLGEIKLGDHGFDLTINLFVNGEPYDGRTRVKLNRHLPNLWGSLTGKGGTLRIVGLPTPEEGGDSQLRLHVELLDVTYAGGRHATTDIMLDADQTERKAVINENIRKD